MTEVSATPPLARPSSPIRTKLALRVAAAFLALGATTVAVVAIVSYRSAESALRERTIARLAAIADADVESMTFWLQRQRAALEFLASLRSVADHATSGTALRRVPLDVLSADELRLIEVPGGRVLASTDSTAIGSFAVQEQYYALGQDSTYTQRIYPSSRTGRPTLTIATPVRRAEPGRPGGTQAVLAAHLDLSDLERVLLDEDGEVPTDVYLVNEFAEFVSAERFGRADSRRGVHSVAIDSAIAGGSGAGLYVDYDGRPVVGVWRWVPAQQIAVIVEASQREAFAPARALLTRSLLTGALALGVLTLGVSFIARRLTRPVIAVARAAERVAAGEFGTVAPVESDDEVGQLARSFNAMSMQLGTLYGELESQFVATRSALADAEANRALMQDMVDNTTALVLVIGLDERVRLANNRLETLFGLPRSGADGKALDELLPGAAARALRAVLEETRTRDIVVERELDLATGEESHTWQCVSFPLRDASGATYALGVIATDLTERARAEEERRHSDAKVQQAQKLESLGIMAGGIAHDFNNILGAVMGNAELGLASLDDPAEVHEALTQISSAARRASDLTRQMLAYAGQSSLRRQVIDVREVLADMVALVRAAQPKKVEFVVQLPNEPLWVEMDPAQLSQVALNLLTNAAESIGDRVGTVTLRARHSAPPDSTDGASWVRIEVEDTGEGMNAEVQRRLFEPFFSTKASGRGLGLSAVNGIIRSAGGVLRLRSAPGEGTQFDVLLPGHEAPEISGPSRKDEREKPRTGAVLVIDDESALRSVVRRALEASGFTVLEAENGLEGLAVFERERAALRAVILDLTMPGLSGTEVLARIRAVAPALAVVIASGYAESDSGVVRPADPYTRFLQKPFGITMLQRVVADLVPVAK